MNTHISTELNKLCNVYSIYISAEKSHFLSKKYMHFPDFHSAYDKELKSTIKYLKMLSKLLNFYTLGKALQRKPIYKFICISIHIKIHTQGFLSTYVLLEYGCMTFTEWKNEIFKLHLSFYQFQSSVVKVRNFTRFDLSKRKRQFSCCINIYWGRDILNFWWVKTHKRQLNVSFK